MGSSGHGLLHWVRGWLLKPVGWEQVWLIPRKCWVPGLRAEPPPQATLGGFESQLCHSAAVCPEQTISSLRVSVSSSMHRVNRGAYFRGPLGFEGSTPYLARGSRRRRELGLLQGCQCLGAPPTTPKPWAKRVFGIWCLQIDQEGFLCCTPTLSGSGSPGACPAGGCLSLPVLA